MSFSAPAIPIDPQLGWKSAAHVLDHTLLDPGATRSQIVRLCAEATEYQFAAFCVQPCWVPLAASLLRSTPVKVCSVVGFPHGATLTTMKRFEAAELLRLGADELDMVMNVGALKSGDATRVLADIRGVAEIAQGGGALLKVILENALLTRDEKILACQLCVDAGADFVKTSTGFSRGGATVEDVALMRQVVGQRAGVKAAGGISTAAQFAAMLAAGADRIGATAAVAIVCELGAPHPR